MEKNYQERDKFFYLVPTKFPVWPYKSRLAIGLNLSDAWFRKETFYRFKIRNTMYEISKEKAQAIGPKFYFPTLGKMPCLIPVEEFERIEIKEEIIKLVPQLSLF